MWGHVNLQKDSLVEKVNRTLTNCHQKTYSGELIISTVLQHTGHPHSIKTNTLMKKSNTNKILIP